VAEIPKPTEKPEKIVIPRKNKRKGLADKDEKSPFSRMYKTTFQKIEAAAEKISKSVEASATSPCNAAPTIKEVMKMVKDCGVQEGTALIHTATFFIMNEA
jgi:hypothetical protein